MARNISSDFLHIQIEFVESNDIENGYTFSKNPTLFVDEVLSAEPADKADVIVYDMIVPDKLPIVLEEGIEGDLPEWSAKKASSIDQRMNSYNNQLVSNIYVYSISSSNGAKLKNNGYAMAQQETALNILVDGRVLLPFGGINTDAKLLSHLTDHSGEICLPAVESYYSNISSTPGDTKTKLGLYNKNIAVPYAGVFAFACVGINQQIVGEMSIQYSAKLRGAKGSTQFIQVLAEVKRYYKRSNGTSGNFVAMPQM